MILTPKALEKICFWLTECRTPELLISLAGKYTDIASDMSANRSILKPAIQGKREELKQLLRDEEENERELDRQYWKPLKAELEIWRHKLTKNKKL